jgi:hypothetical protein
MQDHKLHFPSIQPYLSRIINLVLLVSVVSSCSLPTLPPVNPPVSTPAVSPTSIPQETMITFQLSLPQPIPPGESLFLTILDEVTGLAFNPQNIVMTAEDATHYIVIIPCSLGSIIKYRYSRVGTSSVQEHISDGRSVRYRIYHVEGPGTVQDSLSRWTDTQFLGPTGRITGQIIDSVTNQPVPNILITAGGEQVLTMTDGSFLLEGLPPGTHNLVAYALDGMYQTYQQGATVAPDSTTPASFSLVPTQTVSIVFSVTVPQSTPVDAPLRLAGNLYQLGNTFADLKGGVNTIASRMPILSRLPDGRYAVTINLPVGADIEYKYSLGDGLWNAEHSVDGAFLTRHFVVPNTTTQLNDVVNNWGNGQIAPILFNVTVPAHTPSQDGVSIQLNPGFGWFQPLPMWQTIDVQGRIIWRFILMSPLTALETIQYRICRADQCGLADDNSTAGVNAIGYPVSTSLLPQTIFYTVSNWTWFPSIPEQVNIPNIPVISHGSTFVAGIGFDPSYHPSWAPLLQNAISMSSSLGANWLFLSPTWTYTRNQPLVLEPLPSQDILWPEIVTSILQARSLGMNVGLYPTPNFPEETNLWWQNSSRDFPWWVVWFDRYTQFILNYADLADQYDVGSLVIGGEWLIPALPGGILSDGTPSGVPEDVEFRWRNLIEQIRSHYQGTLVWALQYPGQIQNPPPFLDAIDQVFILWSAPLSSVSNASLTDLQTNANTILDQAILPFQQQLGKPVILAVQYPSADGSSMGCAVTSGGGCVPNSLLSSTSPEILSVILDLQEQSDLYNALFLAVNERSWISGFVSMGFYPPVALQDPSLSVYDKPAGGTLWYWLPRLRGIQP